VSQSQTPVAVNSAPFCPETGLDGQFWGVPGIFDPLVSLVRRTAQLPVFNFLQPYCVKN
jgi:hypothetical protein